MKQLLFQKIGYKASVLILIILSIFLRAVFTNAEIVGYTSAS